MHEQLDKKEPRLVKRDGPMLLHENTCPQTSQSTIEKLHSFGHEILEHPPYSPAISSTNYQLFKQLELSIHDTIFSYSERAVKVFEQLYKAKEKEF